MGLGLTLLTALPVLTPATAHAQLFQGAKDEACQGASLSENGTCDGAGAEQQVDSIAKQALTMFSFVIGVIAVIMVMIGGVKYIVSNGDPTSVNSAKNTLLYAVIGLVIASSAQILVRFVLTNI